MFYNSFGNLFRIHTFGESHGKALGVTIDGLPAGFKIDEDAILKQLARRRPGQSKLSTPRKEADEFEIISGLYDGLTTGVPLTALFYNKDVDSSKYDNMKDNFRPSHADFSYHAKFGHRDHRGGGRSSARETVARVFAGALAEQILKNLYPIEIRSWVSQIYDISSEMPKGLPSREEIDKSLVRCPDTKASEAMENRIIEIRKQKDTLGGIIQTTIHGYPAGRGEPTFMRLEALMAMAMMSIPATKGFDIGSGFDAANMLGSKHNDWFKPTDEDPFQTAKNSAGGVIGGISTGSQIDFRVSFKPVATHFQKQETVDKSGEAVDFTAKGRHDPCVLPRAVPIVESMAALVLLDLELMHRSRI